MARRTTSLVNKNTGIAISREVDSKYDAILVVKTAITDVELVATYIDNGKLDAAISGTAIVTGMTTTAGTPGSQPVWDGVNGVLTIPTGMTGATGAQGLQGIQGPQGVKGDTGLTGNTGSQGFSAYDLAVTGGYVGTEVQWTASLEGAVGQQGVQGVQGITGSQGLQGLKGDTGNTGATGPQGIQGIQGNTGVQGVQGYSMLSGSVNPTTQGVNDDMYFNTASSDLFKKITGSWVLQSNIKGPSGDTGTQGIQGDTGLTGSQGLQGIQGVKGDTGNQGVQGLTGADGISAYQVAVAGGFVGTQAQWVLSLEGAVGPQGIQGETGIQGLQGIQGVTGSTGATGQSAYAIALSLGFVGTEVQWVASLEGAQGIQGVQGATGATGLQGIQGVTGNTGATGPTGNGISTVVRTTGTGAPGTTDIYTITYTDATTSTFSVYNGADGLGSGDMLKTTYDTTNNGVVDNAELVNGLTVETAVPTGAVFTDTVYTHPTNHPASIITQDLNNRFVTDAEKTTWNGKAETTAVTTLANGLMLATDKVKLDGILGTNTGDETDLTIKTKLGITTISGTNTGDQDLSGLATKTGNQVLSATDVLSVSGTTVTLHKGDGTTDSITTQDTIYTHPTTDGNLHVPATGTTNSGKVLTAGATAGSLSWTTIPAGITDHTALTNIGTNTHAQIDTALTRLVNTSGTNTGDETVTTIKTKLGITTLSGSNTGDQDLSGYSLTSHNHTVDGLSNVVITTNSDNEVLAWDSATSKWINQTATEAGLATSIHTHTGVYEPANANIQSHVSSTSNPHSTTAAQVGAMATSHAANAITGLGVTTTALTSGGTGVQGTSTVLARQDHTHTLPAYPTTLPASDVYAWAKTVSKPTYTASEVGAIATGGQAGSVVSSEIIKFDTGVTEGTDLYTFNGSTAKTIDIKAGTNVTLTKAAGSVTISANDTSVAFTELTATPTTLSGYGITDAATSTHNHSGVYQPISTDLTNIDALAGTTGLLKKTATDTWTLDTTAYTTNLGTVTSVSGTAPVSVATGTTTPVISMAAASSGVNGYMTGTYATKLDGIAASANNYVLPTGSSTVIGGTKLFSDVVQTVIANTVSATASRSYGLQLNSSGQLVVNVPWVDTDTNTTYTAGTGITLTGTSFSIASHAGTAGSIGTINLGATTVGVNLGATSTTACSGADTRLSDARTPLSHTHGNITNTGAIGVTASLPIITTTSGVLTTGTFGTTAGTFAAGDHTHSTYQPLDTDLTNIAALTGSSGFLKTNGAGTWSVDTATYGTGTVTSVVGTGTVSGLSLSGTVTTTGNLTLGGTLSVAASNFASQTANTILAAPNGANGIPTFRALTLEDVPDAWVKKSVTCATTANITLSANQVIDGITTTTGMRVLVKNQTTTSQNGIYTASTVAWTRTNDCSTSAEMAGATVSVDRGTTNYGQVFSTVFKDTDTLGTTTCPWYALATTSSIPTTGTAPISYTTGGAISISQATTSTNGYLSSTDWNTFNGKATGLTAGSTSTGAISYTGTTKSAGTMDGGATAPSNTTRLNYDGYFYATRFYGDGTGLTGTPTMTLTNCTGYASSIQATNGTTALNFGNVTSASNNIRIDGAISTASPTIWAEGTGTDIGFIFRGKGAGVLDLSLITTQAQTQTVGDSTTKLATTAFATNQDLGVGQTWQDVTASRVSGTTYTNSTGKPIMIYLSTSGSTSVGPFVVGGVTIYTVTSPSSKISNSFIVPVGATYVVTASSIIIWSELR